MEKSLMSPRFPLGLSVLKNKEEGMITSDICLN